MVMKTMWARSLSSTSRAGVSRLLVANRGEIALRIARTASELDIQSIAIATREDETALHKVALDEFVPVSSYTDSSAVISAAIESECDAIHPGYGFLSESAAFAEQCEAAGLTFVGPRPETLARLGDKVSARQLATELGIPVTPGSTTPCATVDEVRAAMDAHGLSFPVMLKAVGGGGGRGIRPVMSDADLASMVGTCLREAEESGEAGGVFVEELVTDARHVEVQLLGDGEGGLVHLLERECSVQRRRQKMIEICPAPGVAEACREALYSHALSIGRACGYRSAGTCEFLLGSGGELSFLEFNPRIQVEHTVSEEATGIDLVRAQLLIAGGGTLASLGLEQSRIRLRNASIQARVQMTSPGAITSYAEPGGPGVRVDGSLYAGYAPSTAYDPMLTKLITWADVESNGGALGAAAVARRRLRRACAELHLGGPIRTNAAELGSILNSRTFIDGKWTTAMLDEEGGQAGLQADGVATIDPSPLSQLLESGLASSSGSSLASSLGSSLASSSGSSLASSSGSTETRTRDEAAAEEGKSLPTGHVYIRAPVSGRLLDHSDQSDIAKAGESVGAGAAVAVLSSMKMEFAVAAPSSGVLSELLVLPGASVEQGQPIALLREAHTQDTHAASASDGLERQMQLDSPPRADLAKVIEARRWTTDEGRASPGGDPKFAGRVAARAARGQRTARENVAALVDDGSFFEYGRHLVAAQRGRRNLEELRRRTPADGMVSGIGSINGDDFDAAMSKAVVVAYDATVLAGTQGAFNHMKLDRMLALAEHKRLPLVLLAEGGGGRPGDVDVELIVNSMLAISTFRQMGKLSGRVPLVGLASGYCFAGNAALLGACDVVIATANSNIGMAGPAMVEGGGLGKVDASRIGPCSEQAQNGVVDLVAQDEEEACALAKRYLSYFQGALPAPAGGFESADQRHLRHVVPENRKRSYEVREVVETLADAGSWLELRRGYGEGMVSGLIRVHGRPLGVLANSPAHLGGAVDSDGALKAARLMELCDAFDLPLLLLCDTPGFMVGPESERTAAVRKMARLFAVASSISVPFFTLVLRKSYGLGAMAMAGGGAVGENVFHASWPSAEAGPMNLEGIVELGFAKELATAARMPLVGKMARQALYDKILGKLGTRAEALSVARTMETDDVIDPAESREWIQHGMDVAGSTAGGRWRTRTDGGKKRPCVSPW